MKPKITSAVEIEFAPTPDGLVIDHLTLKPASQAAEADLRLFADRIVNGVPGVKVIPMEPPQMEKSSDGESHQKC